MKRKILAAATLLTAILAVTACSSTASQTAVPEIDDPVAGEVLAGSLDGVTMTFAGDGGSTQDAQYEAMWKPFEQASGATMLQDSPQLIAKIEAQVESNNVQWDIVTTSDQQTSLYCGTLFEEIDKSKVDMSQIPPTLGEVPCSIPSILYGLVLVYDKDAYGDNPPSSWADFFDTEKFPGKRGIYNGGSELYAPMVTVGAVADGYDPTTPFESADADRGMAKLESIADDTVFWSTGAESQQLLESGEVSMAAVWTGRALVAEKNGANIGVNWNDWVLLVDYISIVKGSKNTEAAYAAMNYFLGAEQQAKFAELTSYSPINVNSEPDMDAITKSYQVTDPAKLEKSISTDLEFWSDADSIAPTQERWSALIGGAS